MTSTIAASGVRGPPLIRTVEMGPGDAPSPVPLVGCITALWGRIGPAVHARRTMTAACRRSYDPRRDRRVAAGRWRECWMQLVLAILAVVIGLLFAFGGWRFFLILLPFWGFFMGFNIGTEATRALIGDGTFATITSWAIGIVLALVFAVFAYLYYYAAIAVLAGTVGFIIGSSLWGLIGSNDGIIAFILGIGLGAVFAIAALMLNVPKYLVIALSAIGGAALVVAGWFILTGQIPTDNITWFEIGNQIANSFIWLVIWLGIAVLGFIGQMATGTFGPDSYELDRSTYRYGAS
jgi:hypothetical protein